MSKIQDIKIPEGWKLDILWDDMSVQGGFAFKSSDYIDTKWIPLIRISNVWKGYIDYKSPIYLPNSYLEKYREFKLNHNDILMWLTGDLWNITLIKNKDLPALLNQRVWRFKSYNIDNLYLYYLTSSSSFQNKLARFFVGWAQANISPSQIESISVLVPQNLKEQEKIAEILTTIDEDIDKTDKLIEKYKKIKAGLMEDLFTKGIDVTTGKPHTKFKDSELGRIPESWEVERLGNVCNNIWYWVWASAIDYDWKNKYLRITDIDDSSRKFIATSLVSPDFGIEDRYKLKENDIVFARTWASVWKTYIYNKDDWDLYCAWFLIKFSVINANAYFVFNQTLRWYYNNWVHLMSQRSGQPWINAEEYKSFEILLPSIEEQEKIAEILIEADNKIEKEEEYKEKLVKMKKWLMNDLLTGKVRVKF